jgi:glycosyltransferase involved in cell wall biosynthesis
VNWFIITAAYPPDEGGIADHTVALARELAARGDRVWIIAGSGPDGGGLGGQAVKVRRFPGHFGLRAIFLMSRELLRVPKPRQVVIQYVPQAFGPRVRADGRRMRGLPLSVCLWLQFLRGKVWTMFHEIVALPGTGRSLAMRLVVRTTYWMLRLVVRKSSRIFVAAPVWADVIREVTRTMRLVEWLPVPSNLPTQVDSLRVEKVRRILLGEDAITLIGHFGTLRGVVTEILRPVVHRLLDGRPERRFVAIGSGSSAFAAECRALWPGLAARILATGNLPPEQAAEHLAACDVMIEPYPDGVSSRRSSTMGPLALGCVVVTNDGPWTEPAWRESGAVVLAASPDPVLLSEKVEDVLRTRPKLGERAARFYDAEFSLRHMVAVMTGAEAAATVPAERLADIGAQLNWVKS